MLFVLCSVFCSLAEGLQWDLSEIKSVCVNAGARHSAGWCPHLVLPLVDISAPWTAPLAAILPVIAKSIAGEK